MHPHDIDFSSAEFLADPYPFYDIMRHDAPILYREDWGMWFLTAYEDVNGLLRDKRLGRAILHVMSRDDLGWAEEPPEHAPFYRMQRNTLMEMEPPNHTRVKSLVTKAFSPRRVESLRQRIEARARHLLEQSGGELDLLEGFAAPLSVTVIAELLGIPEEGRPLLRPWSNDIVKMYELGGASDADARQAVAAVENFWAYLRDLIAERRKQPQDDLLSGLIAARDDADPLSEDELIATCILILNAGHEATVNVVGNGLLALIRHPAEMQRLRDDPSLTASAIEEMMRYDTPLPLFRRWILADFEYKGYQFKQGTEIAFLLGAANHDPQQFPHPHTFDISRRENPHLSFGAGIHYCLGAPLARLELQIALNTLLTHFPTLELVNEPTYHPTFVFRGVDAVRVRCYPPPSRA